MDGLGDQITKFQIGKAFLYQNFYFYVNMVESGMLHYYKWIVKK
jgi:hypothetical protein